METANKGLIEKIKPLKLMIFDVDGVLTDGRIIYNDEGQETKFFDVRDGHGIKLLMRSGINVAIITARESKVVTHRAANLGIELVYQGRKRKIEAFEELLEKTSLKPFETAYMGDDIIDIPVLKKAGFSAAVSDAVKEVRDIADYVTERPGGRGAAREITEVILKGQGKWEDILQYYLT